jgi:poly-gamma-glutamate capsule biosynthesis protein CapA/YwtB (metallophosphatase superfamily)
MNAGVRLLLLLFVLLPVNADVSGQIRKHGHQRPLTSADTNDVVVNFTGDCVFANHFERQIGDRLDTVFAGLPWFVRSDINMINLEHPVTTGNDPLDKEFVFKMHPRYIRLLQESNILLVNAANNHIYDYGIEGIESTMEYLGSANIAYAGIGKSLQEAREPVIFSVKGKILGFLGYFGGMGQFAATDTSAGLAPRFPSYILSDIKTLREKADYVIVSLHWGIEGESYPEDWQGVLGRASIDAGADLIIGHHPHVLQGIERHNGGVIAYSLGNFLFGGHRRPVHDTIVLQVLFGEKMTVNPLPVRIDHWRATGIEELSVEAVLDSLKIFSRDFKDSFLINWCVNAQIKQKYA